VIVLCGPEEGCAPKVNSDGAAVDVDINPFAKKPSKEKYREQVLDLLGTH
jgi:hypothetical protein